MKEIIYQCPLLELEELGLTKDPYILISSSNLKKANSDLIKSSRIINEKAIINISKRIVKKLKNVKSPKIILCGIAFKGYPENTDTRFSTSIQMIEKLSNKIKA